MTDEYKFRFWLNFNYSIWMNASEPTCQQIIRPIFSPSEDLCKLGLGCI